MATLFASKKRFLVIGSVNAITYKEIFPKIKTNKVWLGPSIYSGDREFEIPGSVVDLDKFTGEIRNGRYYQRVMGVRWFTNLDHGKRHQYLELMTMEQNKKFNNKVINSTLAYKKYDNHSAIEVPYVETIPSDYFDVMGVPISFLDKYNPDQFEILGCSYSYGRPDGWGESINMSVSVGGIDIYKRLLIKHKKGQTQ